jgi:lactoylglutathione lyase
MVHPLPGEGWGEGEPLPYQPTSSCLSIKLCLGVKAGYRAEMSKVKRLLHTRYRVNDLDRTVTFYRDVLGLEEVSREQSPRGSTLVFLKAPASEELIELCSFPGSGPVQVQPDLTHLAFEVDSLSEFEQHLARLGIRFSDGPHVTSGGNRIAFIDAPEGYEIELIETKRGGKKV